MRGRNITRRYVIVLRLPRWAVRTSLAVGVLAGVSTCGSDASTPVEPLTFAALLDVIELSPSRATFIKLDTAGVTSLLARRDGENFALESTLGEGHNKNETIHLGGEFYVPDSGTGAWVHVVGGGGLLDANAAASVTAADTVTLRSGMNGGFESIVDLLDADGLAWSAYTIAQSACADNLCTYELTADPLGREGEYSRIVAKTESVDDGQRLTSLTLTWVESTLELGYDPETISAPSNYTNVGYDLFVSGAANEAELQTVTAEAEAYLHGALQQAADNGLSATSREFWETYLPRNAPDGAGLWVNVPGSLDEVRELVGPKTPYTGIAEDLGETLEHLRFHKGAVSVCVDFANSEVRPGSC